MVYEVYAEQDKNERCDATFFNFLHLLVHENYTDYSLLFIL